MPRYSTADVQSSLPGFCPLTEAVEAFSVSDDGDRGAVYTRREVVEFVLDLAGYTPDQPLHEMRLLEPSFGRGDFLLPAIERLLVSVRRFGAAKSPNLLLNALRAVELNHGSFKSTLNDVQTLLLQHGYTGGDARMLADAWLIRDDFLLADLPNEFTHVIGNPPYVRQESIPQVLIDEYRRRYRTIYDRADLYVPFIERSLSMLANGGTVSFICADRWMKNRYGGPLRRMIAEEFHLRSYVDMVDTPAFHADVVAYPAIFVIARERGRTTRLACQPQIERNFLARLAIDLKGDCSPSAHVREVDIVAAGSEPWLLDDAGKLSVVRRLEREFPTLEDAGCKVGIGVATGADRAYIGPLDELDVEDDRKLPLLMTRDIHAGSIEWRGLGVVNPFGDDGRLVQLQDYPRLSAYLEARKEAISGRHVAKKSPASWYRTIDRIYPELVSKPKLLIPDIKGDAHIVYDEGSYYPHHNLYFITSETWDLRALQAVLRSGIARLFIATYSTKMRGGYLRFQAQYLRRIRIPYWRDVSSDLRKRLIRAACADDQEACNSAVAELYGLAIDEQNFLTLIPEVA